MDKGYYKEYYINERNHWWFKVRERILIERLKKDVGDKQAISILNVGAATGRSSEALSELGKVTSIEYDKECAIFAAEQTGMEVEQGDVLSLRFEDNTFDVVCAFDVIEHVEDDQKAVDEILRVCKPDGNILLTVPAFMSLWGPHDEINHHFRRYKAKQVKKLLVSKNIDVVKSTYFNSILFLPILFFRTLLRTFTSKDKKPESDFGAFKDGIMNKAFFVLFSVEKILLRCISFPLGVSYLISIKKRK